MLASSLHILLMCRIVYYSVTMVCLTLRIDYCCMVIINITYWNWDSIPLHANFIFKFTVFVISEVLRQLLYRPKCVLGTCGEKLVNFVKICSKLELNVFLLV